MARVFQGGRVVAKRQGGRVVAKERVVVNGGACAMSATWPPRVAASKLVCFLLLFILQIPFEP